MKKQLLFAVLCCATTILTIKAATTNDFQDVSPLVTHKLDEADFEILNTLLRDKEITDFDAQIDALCADPVFDAELRALAAADHSLEYQFRSRLAHCCDAASRQDFLTRLRFFVNWCFDNNKAAFWQSRLLRVAMDCCILWGNYFLKQESAINHFFIKGKERWHTLNSKASLFEHERWMKDHLYLMVTDAQCLGQLLAYKARGKYAERFDRVQQTTIPSTPFDTIVFAELYSHQSKKAYVPRSDFAHAHSMPWVLYQSFVRCCSQRAPVVASAPAPQATTLKTAALVATLALSGKDTSGSNSSADRLTPSGAGAGYVPKGAQTATSPPRPKRRGAIAAAVPRTQSDDFDWFVHEDGSPKDADEDAVGVANFFAALSGLQYAAPQAGTKKRSRC